MSIDSGTTGEPGGRPARTTRPSRLSLWLWPIVMGIGAGTLFACFGRLHWVLDLFSNFRLQYAAGAVLVLFPALFVRRWKLALVAGVLMFANLPAVLYYHPAGTQTDTPPALRVVTFNVLTSNPRKEDVLRYLRGAHADVIVVLECSREWTRALTPLEESHPHVVKAPRRDNFGLALYSRHPVQDWELSSVEPFTIPLLRAVLEFEGTDLTIFAAHPLPPMSAHNWRSRNAYLRDLGEQARQAPRPTIVMGDFNATPWSPFFGDLLTSSGLEDSGRRRGFQSTWNRRHPLFSIPIDHILHSPDLNCTRRSIGPALGSDHHPVTADFAIGPDQP